MHDRNQLKAQLLKIALFAILVRVVLLFTAVAINHATVQATISKIDGAHYLLYSKVLSGETTFAELDSRVQGEDPQPVSRLFPGYPALVAAFHSLTGIESHWAGFIINCLASALAAVLAALFYSDPRIGMAMGCFTPGYVYVSIMVMNEPVILACSMAVLYLVIKCKSALLGGAVLGLSAFVRPASAAFTGLALLFSIDRQNFKVRLASFAVAALVAIPIACLAWENIGRSLVGYKVSDGQLLGWPFQAIIMSPIIYKTSLWKIVHVWLNVVFSVGACYLLAREWLRDSKTAADSNTETAPDYREILRASAVWLWLTTLLCICIGKDWGFGQFHRYIIHALPPMLYAYRRYLPSKFIYWLLIAGVSLIWSLSAIIRPAYLQHLELTPR